MARQQVYKDRKITNTEAKRRFDDRMASIDEPFEFAYANIDWKRRNAAEKSIVKWV